jgi:predicted Zn-dependent protease
MDAIAYGMGIAADAAATSAPGDAERLMRERIRLNPQQSQAWGALGRFQWSHGRFADTAASLQHAIELDPSASENHLAFLELVLSRGAPGQAAAFLREGLTRTSMARSPATPAALRALDSGDLPGAVTAARRAYSEAALRQAETIPGNPEFVMRKIFLYRFAAETAPEWREAQEKCGDMLLIIADPACLRYLGRAASLAPRDPSPAIRLGLALLSMNRTADSARILSAVTARFPSEPGGWFYLGQAELGLDRRKEAARAFGRFLALAPSSPQAPAVRRLLASLGTAR